MTLNSKLRSEAGDFGRFDFNQQVDEIPLFEVIAALRSMAIRN